VILLTLIASVSLASPIEETTVVCGQIIVSIPPRAFKLDSVTDKRFPIPDGVYKTENPFCIYVVENGIAKQKTEEQ
jgi:hypothetical protein